MTNMKQANEKIFSRVPVLESYKDKVKSDDPFAAGKNKFCVSMGKKATESIFNSSTWQLELFEAHSNSW